MNKSRRAEIQKVIDALQELEAKIEELRDEEWEYYDNMPESIQSGEKGDAVTECVDTMDYAISSIQDAVSNLEEVVS